MNNENVADAASRSLSHGETEAPVAPLFTGHGSDQAAHNHDMAGSAHDHGAALALVDPSAATHRAVADGDWFDAATWAGGRIPGDGARVTIPEGIAVRYAGLSDARVETIGVAGALSFSPDQDSRLVVDTMVVTPTGRLEAGTANRPVRADVSVDIVIANNGAIDTAWDPMLMSRGVVSLGEVEMRGSAKTSHVKVAKDPEAGDATLELADGAQGWRVGDTIVVAGSDFAGWGYARGGNQYRGDTHEVRVITAIDRDGAGATVTLDRPLDHDHGSPRDDLKVSVANYTRSITISSEDGAASATHERGHVAFMASDDVDVRYVAFDELGRTDKSVRARPAEAVDRNAYDDNVQGRYSVHLHELGVSDQRDPAILLGNAVFGSPGWGVAHHSSHARLHDNATFDTFGAGFVAEAGDETGTWSSNIAIGAEGLRHIDKNAADVAAGDVGRTGSGFWFTGRLVEAVENVAAGVRTGFVWMSRGETAEIDPETFDQPEALGLGAPADTHHPVINNFTGNEVFGSERGLLVVKGRPEQGHDLRSVMTDFTAWEVRTGAHLEYSSHYTLVNFDITGLENPPQYTEAYTGLSVGSNASDVSVIAPRIEGFNRAYSFSDRFTNPNSTDALKQHVIYDDDLSDIRNGDFLRADHARRVERLDADEAGPRPVALDVTTNQVGGGSRAVRFEGVKTDSLGQIPVAAGEDAYALSFSDVVHILRNDGYYTQGGREVFIAEAYYQDRMTGEIVKVGHVVSADQPDLFSNHRSIFHSEVFNGALRPNNRAPVTQGETVVVAAAAAEVARRIDLLANDADPDGDALAVDGLIQPVHGRVFDNGDGTVDYRPDFGFAGSDTFFYWVTDGQGAFTKAQVSVNVSPVGGPGGAPLSLIGTSGLDTIEGTGGADAVTGGRSEDDLKGNGGDDTVVGGAGADMLAGNGGRDELRGGAGRDTLSGGPGDDEVRGGAAADLLRGGGGDDVLRGQGGADRLVGAAGDDLLRGGAGRDSLAGGEGEDRLAGGGGDDVIAGGPGFDRIVGGAGDDIFVFYTGSGEDRVGDFTGAAAGGGDRLEFRTGANRFADLTLEDSQAGVIVGYRGGKVLLVEIDAGDLTAADFIF